MVMLNMDIVRLIIRNSHSYSENSVDSWVTNSMKLIREQWLMNRLRNYFRKLIRNLISQNTTKNVRNAQKIKQPSGEMQTMMRNGMMRMSTVVSAVKVHHPHLLPQKIKNAPNLVLDPILVLNLVPEAAPVVDHALVLVVDLILVPEVSRAPVPGADLIPEIVLDLVPAPVLELGVATIPDLGPDPGRILGPGNISIRRVVSTKLNIHHRPPLNPIRNVLHVNHIIPKMMVDIQLMTESKINC